MARHSLLCLLSSRIVFFFFFIFLLIWNTQVHAQTSSLSSSTSSSTSPFSSLVVRKDFLDRLDVETVEYYFENPDLDYDVAIMYYAAWDTHSQNLAPMWNQIAALLSAGTRKSNLIMGLFDCEASMDHVSVCQKAGVTHYPTLQFYALTGGKVIFQKNKKLSLPKHMTQFHGNWQIYDSIYDWIRSMLFLCQWHRKIKMTGYDGFIWKKSWWIRILRVLLGRPVSLSSSSPLKSELPVGLPLEAKAQRVAMEALEDAKKYGKLVVRASSLVDAMLFPLDRYSQDSGSDEDASDGGLGGLDALLYGLGGTPSKPKSHLTPETIASFTEHVTSVSMNTEGGQDDGVKSSNKTFVDMYEWMTATNSWQTQKDGKSNSMKNNPIWGGGGGNKGDAATALTQDQIVIRACVVELTLDYCERLSGKALEAWLERKPFHELTPADWDGFEEDLKGAIRAQEPYCLSLEECIMDDFAQEHCRPVSCPFQDRAACRYATACLSSELVVEYMDALNMTTTTTTTATT